MNYFVYFEQLEAFKREKGDKLGPAKGATDRAIEKVKANIVWRNNYEDVVYNWLQNTMKKGA